MKTKMLESISYTFAIIHTNILKNIYRLKLSNSLLTNIYCI